jgi:hypothetical protein
MTDEDQDAAIGRLVGSYSAAKKRRAALMAECHRIGDNSRSLEMPSASLSGLLPSQRVVPTATSERRQTLRHKPIQRRERSTSY